MSDGYSNIYAIIHLNVQTVKNMIHVSLCTHLERNSSILALPRFGEMTRSNKIKQSHAYILLTNNSDAMVAEEPIAIARKCIENRRSKRGDGDEG